MEKFYMVFVENGGAPTYKHEDFKTAEAEAKRLAEYTGRKTYVLMSIESVEVNKFNIIRLVTDENELPF